MTFGVYDKLFWNEKKKKKFTVDKNTMKSEMILFTTIGKYTHMTWLFNFRIFPRKRRGRWRWCRADAKTKIQIQSPYKGWQLYFPDESKCLMMNNFNTFFLSNGTWSTVKHADSEVPRRMDWIYYKLINVFCYIW